VTGHEDILLVGSFITLLNLSRGRCIMGGFRAGLKVLFKEFWVLCHEPFSNVVKGCVCVVTQYLIPGFAAGKALAVQV